MQQSDTANVIESAPSNETWAEALRLPCQVSFGLRIPRFTVGDLLRLDVQSVVDTGRAENSDIEVELNGRPIGWAELEALGEHLAFRLTEVV